MKNIFLKVLLSIFFVLPYGHVAYCQSFISPDGIYVVPNLKNNPLPQNPSVLRVLGIGNSFTDDAMEYLPDLLASAGINNVVLGKLSLGGSSLEKHFDLYEADSAAYSYLKSEAGVNRWMSANGKRSLKFAVADEPWDVIIIQQVSSDAGLYNTYQPFLNDLIDIIKVNCPNAGVALGWQMTWAYGSASNHGGFANYGGDQMTMYNAIVNAVKEMVVRTGIDIVIPSGTAIQNLRGTSINNAPADLTRDGFHIDLGAGRYTLACTWFQCIIAPCLDCTISNNPFRVDKGEVPVSNTNYKLCQMAAQYACSRRFEVSTIE